MRQREIKLQHMSRRTLHFIWKCIASLSVVLVALVSVYQVRKPSDDLEKNEVSNLWYNGHTEDDQVIYSWIYEGFQNWSERIFLNLTTYENLEKFQMAVKFAEPELFHVSTKNSYSTFANDQHCVFYYPDYWLEKEDYEQKLEEMRSKADSIISEVITEDMSDWDKAKAIHDYIIDTTEYLTADTQGAEFEYYRTAYGCLVEGKANCEGYALAYNYLLRKLGIQCETVVGDVKGDSAFAEAHAWNLVNIDGQWAHVDVCWDDDSGYVYFMRSTEFMEETRDMERNAQYLGEIPETTDALNYFSVTNHDVENMEDFVDLVNEDLLSTLADGGVWQVKVDSEIEFTRSVYKSVTLLKQLFAEHDITNYHSFVNANYNTITVKTS